ncbi:MAG: aldehyde dehydrogenase family protein [Woeseiaceae bacterium]|nr:aldehyde dehydrogenase family protein [Woeseiaceae bacterium]
MSDTLQVRNPRTGELDYEISVATTEKIAQLSEQLRANQPGWRDAGIDGRIAVLQRWQAALQDNADAIVGALSIDTGRHALAQGELDSLLRSVDRWCEQAPGLVQHQERPATTMPDVGIRQQHEPFPLLGAISPWNFPLLLSFIDAVPALLAGCAAIIKPSEVTPRFAAPVSDAIAAVPELHKVLRFVSGDGRSGAALIEHVDVVAFTGSVATGKVVARAAADAFIPAFLELGGKDPVVLLQGTDLERAATAILRASVAATGQACQSLERIYVHESQHDEFVTLLSEKAAAVELSYPDAHKGIIGPLIFAHQADIIATHLQDAYEKGAVAHTGGEVLDHDGGKFIAPTVLSNVDHTMKVMTEETFGPVMPVMRFSAEQEAIALANDSRYGLSGAVFGASEEDALRVATQLNVGGVSVNDAGMTTMIFDACKSAFNMSGMGPSRMGPPGLTRFFRQKALYINRGDVIPVDIFAER